MVGSLLSTARQFHLLPEAYIYGSGLTVQFASERVAFLNGQFGTTGWWWYFPYAFAVKTTIPGHDRRPVRAGRTRRAVEER